MKKYWFRAAPMALLQMFIPLLLLAQSPPPKTPQASHPPPPSLSFTQLETVIAKDIQDKQAALQTEVDDFMVEVRLRHPGFEFQDGILVPIPPPPSPTAPAKNKDEKKQP